MENQYGRVKWFSESQGFGFIAPDLGGEDVFAHYSQIQLIGFKTLSENQRVQYDVLHGKNGIQATYIRPF